VRRRFPVNRLQCRALSRADLEHLFGSRAIRWIWYQVASAELFESDLTFSEFLVDESKFLMFQQDLQAELLADDGAWVSVGYIVHIRMVSGWGTG
jgi:hypothetical protein